MVRLYRLLVADGTVFLDAELVELPADMLHLHVRDAMTALHALANAQHNALRSEERRGCERCPAVENALFSA